VLSTLSCGGPYWLYSKCSFQTWNGSRLGNESLGDVPDAFVSHSRFSSPCPSLPTQIQIQVNEVHSATVWNFGSAVGARFFLGVFEAAVTPGFTLLSSQWWTKKEQGARIGIWFSFNGMGQIFGGLVAYGINVGAEKSGSAIEPWKIVFLVNGLLTACLGVVFWFVIPDNQLNARWLSAKDRVLAVARVRVNQQGIGNKHFKMYQLKEALLDPMTWAFVFYALVADIPNGGISNFFSQLSKASFVCSHATSTMLMQDSRLIRLYAVSVSPLWYTRWRRRSCCPNFLWLAR
jgi:MFS family permease